MVTERTIDGDRPAKIANDQSDKTTKVNFNREPFLELLIGFIYAWEVGALEWE